MLTVKALVDELGLELASGQDSAEKEVRWVHISELSDPTPWISGGELLLTTGSHLNGVKTQREFVRTLVDREVSGLGYGLGENHDEMENRIPKALVQEAIKRGLPVFEIPPDLPFIAITKAASIRLINEQYELLQRGISVHQRLERLVLEEQGLDEIVAAIAAAISGSVLVFDSNGEAVAQKTPGRRLSKKAIDAIASEVVERASRGGSRLFAPADPSVAERALVYPVAAQGTSIPQAWLVAVGDRAGLGDFERLILQQAVTVVALELMRGRVAQETERRLAGNVLAEAFSGRLSPEELRSRLQPFGIGDRAAVIAFKLEDPSTAEPILERALSGIAAGSLVATYGSDENSRLLCAVVDCGESDVVELATKARQMLATTRDPVRAAASRVAPIEMILRSFHEARCALEATAMANGDAPDVASHRDLGAFTILLSAQDDEALRAYCEGVLAPIEDADDEYADELLRSLEAFIEHNGQWAEAARHVYCHRHTLRYRIKRIEELTGRDLGHAQDRIEFWLALRARELIN